MFGISFWFSFIITTNIAASSNNIISNNGWKPLTYEQVFRGFLKPKLELQPLRLYNRNVDVINLVKPHVFTEFTINNDASYPEKIIQAIPPTIGLPDAVNNCGTKDNFNCLRNSQKGNTEDLISSENDISNEKVIIKPQRIAKKISVENAKENFVKTNILEDNTGRYGKDFKDDVLKNQELQEAETYLYKVTEEESTDEDRETSKGYVYEKPSIKRGKDHNNITESFFKTLSKYNIKVNDESENYKLSRKPRTEIDKPRQLFYLPIPVVANGNRMNDLSHLLAVFLSNYGYYLPGYYGLANKYRNLYGYLATNNIHNNKPFGLYKVFADNDSSNK